MGDREQRNRDLPAKRHQSQNDDHRRKHNQADKGNDAGDLHADCEVGISGLIYLSFRSIVTEAPSYDADVDGGEGQRCRSRSCCTFLFWIFIKRRKLMFGARPIAILSLAVGVLLSACAHAEEDLYAARERQLFLERTNFIS